MSYVRERRIGWTVPDVSDVEASVFYVGPAGVTTFLDQVSARTLQPFSVIPTGPGETGTVILGENSGLDEGDYQFAVVVRDRNGNLSDPYQFSGWQNVPLDLTPPPPATDGFIEFVD